MKFCRNCGSSLAAAQAPPMQPPPMQAPPNPFANMPPPGPLAALTPNPQPGMPPPPPTLPPGAASASSLPQVVFTPHSAPPGAPTMMPASAPVIADVAPPVARAAPPGTIACPRCGAATPIGFVYCQACGLHIQAVAPTDPGGPARPRTASQPAPLPPAPSSPGVRVVPAAAAPAVAVDPQGATLAAPGSRPAPSAIAPLPSAGVAWGTAVLVNRDGTDGERHPLDAEYTVLGRGGADIAFDDDRFLARQHARLERAADGSVRIAPTDQLNGVFRKTDAPVELTDGLVILVGREVLRYERVELEERNVTPLIRHGVALFGSPPREPWGRLLQILPSGGYRDIRHLAGDEVVLGREEGDIVFRDDAFMSRRHAAITWDGKRAQLTDLGSSNGTFVRLTGPTPIKHGDHLRLGDQLLRIELGR